MKIGLLGYLWRHAFYVVVVQLAVYGLSAAFEYVAPEIAAGFHGTGASTGLSIASIMLPGIYVGQKWARTEGVPMPRGFAWGLSLACTLLLAVMSLAFANWLIHRDPAFAILWGDLSHDPAVLWSVGAVTGLMLLLVTRLALWSAVKGELKRQARLAAQP